MCPVGTWSQRNQRVWMKENSPHSCSPLKGLWQCTPASCADRFEHPRTRSAKKHGVTNKKTAIFMHLLTPALFSQNVSRTFSNLFSLPHYMSPFFSDEIFPSTRRLSCYFFPLRLNVHLLPSHRCPLISGENETLAPPSRSVSLLWSLVSFSHAHHVFICLSSFVLLPTSPPGLLLHILFPALWFILSLPSYYSSLTSLSLSFSSENHSTFFTFDCDRRRRELSYKAH